MRVVILFCALAASSFAQSAAPIRSPEVSADGRVTFRLRAPAAQQVSVRGIGARLTMQKDDAGVWSATTEPLQPDIYLYSFNVDGGTFTDPVNPLLKTSYPSGAQSMVHVPGAVAWEPAAVERGVVSHHWYRSDVIGNARDYYVYTPPGYDRSRAKPYPVLFLLHGLTDDASAWMTVGAANVILDNLIGEGKAVPMVIVCPLGYGTASMLIDRPDNLGGEAMMPNFTRSLLTEVMPRVEHDYNVSRDRTERAIAGLSMGGAEAVFAGLNHLDTFAWIGSFSGAFNLFPGSAGAAANDTSEWESRLKPIFPDVKRGKGASLKLLWISCGNDDFLMGVNEHFTEWLSRQHVALTNVTVPAYAHVWPLWRRNLAEFAPLLFR